MVVSRLLHFPSKAQDPVRLEMIPCLRSSIVTPHKAAARVDVACIAAQAIEWTCREGMELESEDLSRT